MIKKPLIFYCDDKCKWTNQFKKRHSEKFEIETINNSKDFSTELAKSIKLGKTPNIILIDLYHPKGKEDTDEQKKLEDEGQAAIERLNKAVAKEKEPILKAWEPHGYVMLKEARKLCPDTPIAIYTEQGLTLADDDELKKVSECRGEWFLKGKTDFYEAHRLNSMLSTNLYDKITRHTLWILSAIIIVAAFGYSLAVEKKIINTLSFGATLVSMMIAVTPRIISYLVRKEQK